MKKVTAMSVLLGLLSNSAQADWVEEKQSVSNKFLLCSSNTGTDGDLIFEVPVRILKMTKVWRGESTEDHNSGDVRTSYTIELSLSQKTANLADITDMSPLSAYKLTVSKTKFSENYDLKLRAAGYRIVVPSYIESLDSEITGADSNAGEIGVSRCSLNEQNFNSRIQD